MLLERKVDPSLVTGARVPLCTVILYTIYHKESDTCRILFYCIEAIIIGILCNLHQYELVVQVLFLTIWHFHV